jgi:hypothetical protein
MAVSLECGTERWVSINRKEFIDNLKTLFFLGMNLLHGVSFLCVCKLIIYLLVSNVLYFSALSIPGFIKIDSRQRLCWWGGRMENERDTLGL